MENLTQKELELVETIKSEFKKHTDGFATKEEVTEAVKKAIADAGYVTQEAFNQVKTAAENIGLEIKAMKEGEKAEGYKTPGQQFKDYFLANKEKMEDLTSGKVKELRLNLKVAANMLASTNITGTVPAAVREPGLNDIAREQRFIMDVIGYGPTSSKTIEFVEKVNADGTVAFVLDTEAFAQIDFDLQVGTSTAKDVGAFITVHENMLADIDFMASEIDKELIYQIKKAADGEVLSGTGLTSHLKGITVFAATGFSLTSVAVKTPNIGDCISAAIRQVELVGFDVANFILLNPADYENLIGTKDNDGRYVGHPLLSPDGTTFAGIPITRTSFITAGYLLVGNKMKSNIKVLQDIELAMGYNLTGEFTKRLLTVRGSMRLHHYIKDNDTGSFVYDAIADIKAAITEV